MAGESNCVVLTHANRIYGWGRGVSSDEPNETWQEVISYLPLPLSNIETIDHYLLDHSESLEPILSVSEDTSKFQKTDLIMNQTV